MKKETTKEETKTTNTVSGNYQTADEEIQVVKDYLAREGIKYEDVYKYADANAGDVMVKFPNKMYSLFEVKREEEKRFSKYGEYGIDFISSLVFKKGVKKEEWRGLHNPKDFPTFMESLNISHKCFKWGKLGYSYSNVWLFYVKNDKTGKYTHLECYDGEKLKQEVFFDYLVKNCQFAVNKKPASQMSNGDKFDSATFFVKPHLMRGAKLDKNKIYNHADMGLLKWIKIS